MDRIKFEDYKPQIIEAISRKNNLGINEPVTLLNGFVNTPIQNEISGSVTIGGPTVPIVILLGINSGRIYMFALKAILPNVKI